MVHWILFLRFRKGSHIHCSPMWSLAQLLSGSLFPTFCLVAAPLKWSKPKKEFPFFSGVTEQLSWRGFGNEPFGVPEVAAVCLEVCVWRVTCRSSAHCPKGAHLLDRGWWSIFRAASLASKWGDQYSCPQNDPGWWKYSGWTKSCTTLKPWLEPLFLGIYRGIMIHSGFVGGAKWISSPVPSRGLLNGGKRHPLQRPP